VLKKTKKKIKQLHQQFMKSHIQEELILKELEMMKEVVEMKKKDGLKHHQEIITKANAKINFRNNKIKSLNNE